MPIYTYTCRCGSAFDRLQRMPGQATAKCPHCGRRAKKTICAVGIVFKGPGFHNNDYGPYGRKEEKA